MSAIHILFIIPVIVLPLEILHQHPVKPAQKRYTLAQLATIIMAATIFLTHAAAYIHHLMPQQQKDVAEDLDYSFLELDHSKLWGIRPRKED